MILYTNLLCVCMCVLYFTFCRTAQHTVKKRSEKILFLKRNRMKKKKMKKKKRNYFTLPTVGGGGYVLVLFRRSGRIRGGGGGVFGFPVHVTLFYTQTTVVCSNMCVIYYMINYIPPRRCRREKKKTSRSSTPREDVPDYNGYRVQVSPRVYVQCNIE